MRIPLNPAALAFVPFGIVLVRVRVQPHKGKKELAYRIALGVRRKAMSPSKILKKSLSSQFSLSLYSRLASAYNEGWLVAEMGEEASVCV